MVHASEHFRICPLLRSPLEAVYLPSDGFNPFCGVITLCNEKPSSMRLKLPFSPCFLCHSPAVAPLLLSICPGIPPTLPPVPRIEETARNFSTLCRNAGRDIVLHVKSWHEKRAPLKSWHEKRTPRKAVEALRNVLIFRLCHLVDGMVFLNVCSFQHIISLSFAVFNPSRLFFCRPSSAYAPECPYMPFIDPLTASYRLQRISAHMEY